MGQKNAPLQGVEVVASQPCPGLVAPADAACPRDTSHVETRTKTEKVALPVRATVTVAMATIKHESNARCRVPKPAHTNGIMVAQEGLALHLPPAKRQTRSQLAGAKELEAPTKKTAKVGKDAKVKASTKKTTAGKRTKISVV